MSAEPVPPVAVAKLLQAAATLDSLSARYSAFFVDQFGVLHDGTVPYPGAPEALLRLSKSGKPVILLSNSGRPAAFNIGRMERLGFPQSSFAGFVTSGDVAVNCLKSGAIPLPQTSGGVKCFTVSAVDDQNLAEAMGFVAADSIREAGLLVISGSRGHEIAIDQYRELLAPAVRSNVPAICTNPDRIMFTPRGTAYGPGRIASLYESMGGKVWWVGKPHGSIYARASDLAGNPPPHEILCIGDSVEHDVAGARSFGAASALVRTGIHAGLTTEELDAEILRFAAAPDWIIPAFA